MTFLTFGAAYIEDGDGIHFMRAEVAGKRRVHAVKFIAWKPGSAIGEVDPGAAMAIDTPAHA